ncbi:MAG TPA: DAK2 domain-containing protein [Candidatus Nanopelagicaceae bacterium]
MNSNELRTMLEDALATLDSSRDELRDLDAAIGDGDLGITVVEGARAVREGLRTLPPEAGISLILRTCAQRFASANPSTMSALVAAGLLAASKRLGEVENIDRAGALVILEAATDAIQTRGGAALGDKTVIDALRPTIDALQGAGPENKDALEAMIKSARQAVTETASLQSQKGRAAWIGERTMGHPDGGATAYLRLLEAIAGTPSFAS